MLPFMNKFGSKLQYFKCIKLEGFVHIYELCHIEMSGQINMELKDISSNSFSITNDVKQKYVMSLFYSICFAWQWCIM